MLVTKKRLIRALAAYQRYQPTASESLRESREKWIPCRVKSAASKKRVREVAESILQGIWQGPSSNPYQALHQEHQLAVALVLMTTWSEVLWDMHLKGAKSETTYTQRVFEYLLGILPEHVELAIRNWGKDRDGGEVPAMGLIIKMQVTRLPVVMQVYLAIRQKWDQRGYDWDRRHREEAGLVHSN